MLLSRSTLLAKYEVYICLRVRFHLQLAHRLKIPQAVQKPWLLQENIKLLKA